MNIYTPNENDVSAKGVFAANEKVAEAYLKRSKIILDKIEPLVPKIKIRSKVDENRVMYSTANIVPRLQMAADQLKIPIATGLYVGSSVTPQGMLIGMGLGIYRALGGPWWSDDS